MVLTPGTRLAQYEIVAPLGSGGMGEVYRARDSRLERDVAIKVLSARLADDPEMRERFEREARAVASLSHPNVMSIHELAVVEGIRFAVVELLEGETLRVRLNRGPLDWRAAAELGAAVADGIAAAHAKGIVHRDLKPENIIITTDGRAKVLDFGLARQTDAAPTGAAESGPTVAETLPGIVLGTIGYIAPEQVLGSPADARSDIFAFGCVLYEMLTGRRAFARATSQETLTAILRDEPAPLALAGAPEGVAQVVAHCLEKEPGRRFQSARDAAEALRALLSDSGSARTQARRGGARGKSLAVLPFLNVGVDASAEYLSDGVTESIINNLSQLPKLRVVPRSTVFRYKGREVDVRAVGLALNVRTLLMGRVAQRGDVLNIQAELVDTATESQLWGQQFNRRVADIFAVQEEIAWQISEALRLKLSGEDRKRLCCRPTESHEAYDLYLKGRFHWNRWTADDFRKSIEFFDRAIAVDPRYALAYAGKSQAYGAMAYYGFVRPTEGFPLARAAALTAVELDDTLADGHVTLALADFFHGWNWPAAERSFLRAIELDSKLATAHSFYGLWLSSQGRHEQAVAEARIGQRLDPQGLIINVGVAWALHWARRSDECIAQLQRVHDLDPSFAEAVGLLAVLYETTGRLADAARMLARPECHYAGPAIGGRIAAALEAGGPDAYWRARLAGLRELTAGRYEPPYFFAATCARMGDVEGALAWLDRAYAERNGPLVFLNVDPAFDSLRGDPRFQELRRRVGLA